MGFGIARTSGCQSGFFQIVVQVLAAGGAFWKELSGTPDGHDFPHIDAPSPVAVLKIGADPFRVRSSGGKKGQSFDANLL